MSSSTVHISGNSSHYCKYIFDTDSYYISGYHVHLSTISIGDAIGVYREEPGVGFTEEAILDTAGDSVTVTMPTLGTYYDMYIVLIPSDHLYANISVTHISALNTGTDSSLSGGAIAGIIIACIAVIAIFVGLSILLIYFRRKRMSERIEDSKVATRNISQNQGCQTNRMIITSRPQLQRTIEESQIMNSPQPMSHQQVYYKGSDDTYSARLSLKMPANLQKTNAMNTNSPMTLPQKEMCLPPIHSQPSSKPTPSLYNSQAAYSGTKSKIA